MAETLALKIKAAAIICAVFIVNSLSFDLSEVNGQAMDVPVCAVRVPSRCSYWVWLRAHHGTHFTLSRIVQKGGISQCTIPISATIQSGPEDWQIDRLFLCL
jgi:hypothetical protein